MNEEEFEIDYIIDLADNLLPLLEKKHILHTFLRVDGEAPSLPHICMSCVFFVWVENFEVKLQKWNEVGWETIKSFDLRRNCNDDVINAIMEVYNNYDFENWNPYYD